VEESKDEQTFVFGAARGGYLVSRLECSNMSDLALQKVRVRQDAVCYKVASLALAQRPAICVLQNPRLPDVEMAGALPKVKK
jgi:hypothetical protein